MSNYKIVVEFDTAVLEKMVNELIDDDFVPLGPPMMVGGKVVQTMVNKSVMETNSIPLLSV